MIILAMSWMFWVACQNCKLNHRNFGDHKMYLIVTLKAMDQCGHCYFKQWSSRRQWQICIKMFWRNEAYHDCLVHNYNWTDMQIWSKIARVIITNKLYLFFYNKITMCTSRKYIYIPPSWKGYFIRPPPPWT